MNLDKVQSNEDYSSIPYEVFHSQEVYEREREKIFKGSAWLYLCLEEELPNTGDFLVTVAGDIPVIVNKTEDGRIVAFENRCMHRGTKLRRENRGNDTSHVCVYHQWCYGLDGQLTSVPFARGAHGKGGLPKDFDKARIRLADLRVEIIHGTVWGTFNHDNVGVEEYLGPKMTDILSALFFKPIEIIGYQRQRVKGNWKLYNENLRDLNHGGLLHMFHATFGLARPSMKGGARLDDKYRHNISYTTTGSDDEDVTKAGYEGTKKVFQGDFQLHDSSILDYKKELPNPDSLIIASVFPNVIFQQINNSLCSRQIRLRGVDEFELYWTFYGFQDDDEDMREKRRLQANLVGPAGLVSMEDGEAVQLVHDQTRTNLADTSQIIIGGRGEICDQETGVTEVPIRGFWSHYYDVMELD